MTEVERLYNLLPGLYRQGDQTGSEPLRALLAVLQGELDLLERDIEAAYDNWFVQTCDLWALPYLAELVGLPALAGQARIFSTQRRQVANAIAYGRRKGSLGVLEHVLRDVTGWHVRAAELAQQVAATPRLSGTPAGAPATADLRDREALGRLGGPFSRQGHSADLRTIAPAAPGAEPAAPGQAGRYNLGRLGLFVWRLRSYTMRRCPIRPAHRPLVARHNPAPDGFPLYAVEPAGRAIQLFNQPALLDDIAERTEARHIPLPLTRVALAADLAAYRAIAHRRPEDIPPASAYYGPGRGLLVALAEHAGADAVPIPPHAVASVDLLAVAPGALAALRRRKVRVAIDPERGWLAVLEPDTPPERVIVDYTYGFGAEIGGGPYHRRSLQPSPPGGVVIVVAKGTGCASLGDALRRWAAYCSGRTAPKGLIRILDNGIYAEGASTLRLELPAGAELTIAADNGVRPTISLGAGGRLLASCEQRLTLGATSEGGSPAADWIAERSDGRLLCLDGLRLDGELHIEWAQAVAGTTSRLAVHIRHCTIAPGVTLQLAPACARATMLQITCSLLGPLRAPAEMAGILASDTILDGAPQREDLAVKGLAVEGPPLDLERVTVLGDLVVAALSTRDSLVAGVVRGADPEASHSHLQLPGREDLPAPRFSALRLGSPAYGQLHRACPATIQCGASDGGELGAFHTLYHQQAVANLAPALDEYLPLGLEAGIFYMS